MITTLLGEWNVSHDTLNIVAHAWCIIECFCECQCAQMPHSVGNLTTEILGLWSVWLKWDLESVACGLDNSSTLLQTVLSGATIGAIWFYSTVT